jgi:hypothetical protein
LAYIKGCHVLFLGKEPDVIGLTQQPLTHFRDRKARPRNHTCYQCTYASNETWDERLERSIPFDMRLPVLQSRPKRANYEKSAGKLQFYEGKIAP